jgi:chaperonin GroEL (HSP60 family)
VLVRCHRGSRRTFPRKPSGQSRGLRCERYTSDDSCGSRCSTDATDARRPVRNCKVTSNAQAGDALERAPLASSRRRNVATLVLRAPNPQALAELSVAVRVLACAHRETGSHHCRVIVQVDGALKVLTGTLSDSRVLPGAGCWEVHLAAHLRGL